MMIDIVQSILDFNRGREPERLRMKYAKLRADAFPFLRGTCHLFFARLPDHALFHTAPAVWSCGDLHLENFGSYHGEHHLTCFDINDFDEAALAPLTWDVVRFLSSVLVGASQLRLRPGDGTALCHAFLDAYNARLASGISSQVERTSATGLLRKLLDQAALRTRAEFLDKQTSGSGADRKIKIRTDKTLAVLSGGRERVTALIDGFAGTQSNPDFYRVVDVARRIRGTGSLGIERDIVLVRGEGGADGHVLLDLKRTLPSSLLARLGTLQPRWPSEAARVVTLQSRLQAVPVARLQAIVAGDTSYVLRTFLPSEDGVTLSRDADTFDRIAAVISSMGDLAASAHLRGAGHDHAAGTEQLMAFARTSPWRASMLDLATQCARQVEDDWAIYCRAFDDHVFDVA